MAQGTAEDPTGLPGLQGSYWLARAPGRLDLMGGIVDYCGGLVLETPLAESAWVGLQRIPEPFFEVANAQAPPACRPLVRESWESWYEGGRLIDSLELRRRLKTEPDKAWAGYLLGVLYLLLHWGWMPRFEGGARLCLRSEIPLGAGVSSSAALEVATLQAACAAWGLEKTGLEKAALAQAAENLVVGAPCGIMDQTTSLLGRKDRLLALLCRPCEIQDQIVFPPGTMAFGVNTGVKHSVGGRAYVKVRVGARMAETMLFDGTGYPGPYLAALSWDEYTAKRGRLPRTVMGSEFLRLHRSLRDPVVSVEPEETYNPLSSADHHVGEGRRVPVFANLLREAATADPSGRKDLLMKAGLLMAESHKSYGSNCGLGCAEADDIVTRLTAAGPGEGIYGAKISGGGAGGTVVVLAEKGAEALIRKVAAEYQAKSGNRADVFAGSSEGALATPPRFIEEGI